MLEFMVIFILNEMNHFRILIVGWRTVQVGDILQDAIGMSSANGNIGYEYLHNERSTNRPHFQLDAVEPIQSPNNISKSIIFD